jgi:hypothetical protein
MKEDTKFLLDKLSAMKRMRGESVVQQVSHLHRLDLILFLIENIKNTGTIVCQPVDQRAERVSCRDYNSLTASNICIVLECQEEGALHRHLMSQTLIS